MNCSFDFSYLVILILLLVLLISMQCFWMFSAHQELPGVETGVFHSLFDVRRLPCAQHDCGGGSGELSALSRKTRGRGKAQKTTKIAEKDQK